MDRCGVSRQGSVSRLLWVAAFGLAAVAGSATAQSSLRELTLSTWTTKQGLPQNFISTIDQTDDGFLWVGTLGGLARFDGLTFRAYFPGEPTAAQSGINKLTHDREGRLWIAASRGLLWEQGGVFHQIALPASDGLRVDDVQVAPDGTLWIRMGKQLLHLDRAFHAAPVKTPGTGAARSFTVDGTGAVWVADGQAVWKLFPGRPSAEFAVKDAMYVHRVRDGSVYAGDGHHLFRFNGQEFAPIADPGSEEFVAVMQSRDGALWLASGGLGGVSRKTASGVEQFRAKDGLAANDARVLFEDRDGDVWIGTIDGLQRLRHGAFIRVGGTAPIASLTAQYDSIAQARDGSVWAGTVEDGVAAFRDGKWTNYAVAAGLRAGQVRGFAQGAEPNPWVALSDYGVFRWNGKKFEKVPGLPAGYVTSPIGRSDGSVWVSVLHQGVFSLKDGKSVMVFGKAQGFEDPMVWALTESVDGAVWAGTQKGVYRFANGRWTRIYAGLNEMVATISIGSRGEVFAGTTSGLVILHDKDMIRIGRGEGLPADTVLQVVEAPDGALWVVTAGGLCRIPPDQRDAIEQHRAKRVDPQRFTEQDGLPSRDFLPLSQVLGLRASDGRLWFETSRGPAVGGAVTDAPPHAFVDGVLVDGDPRFGGEVSIPPGRHRVVIPFTAPDFAAPEQMRFRYRLVGWDTDWVDAGSIREAVYAGLPPGSYQFMVQAIGRGGVQGLVVAGPSLQLRPFFWQTRWFIALAILVLLACIVEFTRRRTLRRARRLSREFQERAVERERIAYQIHDTVIQDLIGATLQLELAEMELDSGDVDPHRPLEGLAARLRETISRSRSMVANLHSSALPEYGLMDVLRLSEAEFRLAAEPAFSIEQTGEARELEPLVRDEMYRICREAIANAFRHGRARNVLVRVQFEPARVVVEVKDDGVGMPPEVVERGRAGHFGLHAMRSHAEHVGAQLHVHSAPGEGTSVRVVLRTPWWTQHENNLVRRLRALFVR